ncbi:hypothetical protein [Neorhizobium sp. SOG26]|uniref:hypothetical protein n=1 Tax=Neorhizobium sp. SOG26 TaxID=2060726 RepID=UPI00123793A2|nr:hypothetical protein [Neorhizobium sp. SOG26]
MALSLTFGVSLAAVLRYALDAFRAFRSGRGGAEFLIVAVFSMVLLLLVQRTWGIVLRVYDRPDWLVNSPMTIFIPWMLAWSVSLTLVAPDMGAMGEENRASLWRSIALFIAGALAGFVLSTTFHSQNKELSALTIWPQFAGQVICPTQQPGWAPTDRLYNIEDAAGMKRN